MTDITKTAQSCASRIMDRMEMCRGSAILKSDIEREVETALRELVELPAGKPELPYMKSFREVWEKWGVEFADQGDETGERSDEPAPISEKALKALTDPHMRKRIRNLEAYPGFRFREKDDGTLIHEPIPMEEFYPDGEAVAYGTSPADISELGKGIARLGREIHDEAARIRKPVGRYIRKSDESDDN